VVDSLQLMDKMEDGISVSHVVIVPAHIVSSAERLCAMPGTFGRQKIRSEKFEPRTPFLQ